MKTEKIFQPDLKSELAKAREEEGAFWAAGPADAKGPKWQRDQLLLVLRKN